MSKYSRLGKNTLLVFIGNIGSKLIVFIMLPFYTTWLSVSDYGITDMITIYVSFLTGIVTLCLGEAIFIYPKGQEKEKQKSYFSSALAFYFISFILTGLLFLLVKNILISISIDNSFTKYTWYIYMILIFKSIQLFLQQFSRSLDKIKIYAISGVILTLSTAIFAFLLIPKHGLYGYIVSQILALIITSLYTFFATKSYIFTSIRHISNEAYKEMLKYSIPLVPNGIMWWIISSLNRPITEKYLGLHDVGIFAVANKFPAIIVILFSIFSYSWQISVLEEFNKGGYKVFYNRMIQVIFSLLILVSCVMSISSPFLISIVNDDFHEAVSYIPLLSLSVIFSSFSGLVGTNFSAVRKSKYYFYSSIWGAISSLIFSIILIPQHKLYGACLAIVISHLIMAITRLIYSWKYVQVEKLYMYVLLLMLNIILIIQLHFWGNNLIYSCMILGVVIVTLLSFNKRSIKSLMNYFTK